MNVKHVVLYTLTDLIRPIFKRYVRHILEYVSVLWPRHYVNLVA